MKSWLKDSFEPPNLHEWSEFRPLVLFLFSTTASEYTHKQSRAGAARGQESRNIWRFIDSIAQIVTHGFKKKKKKKFNMNPAGHFPTKICCCFSFQFYFYPFYFLNKACLDGEGRFL